MRILVTLSVPHGEQSAYSVQAGITHAFFIRSPYLVSAGQNVELHVTATPQREASPPEPGNHLIDATAITRKKTGPVGIGKPLVFVPSSQDYGWIPSERPLYAILADVVQHGVDSPSHGVDCVCMDAYAYEIRRHVARVLPERAILEVDRDQDMRSMNAGWRIAHVMRMATGRI